MHYINGIFQCFASKIVFAKPEPKNILNRALNLKGLTGKSVLSF